MRVLLLFLLIATPAAADETTIMVRAYAWLMDMEGSVRGDDDGLVGTSIDVDRVLRTEDYETGFGGSVDFPLLWGMRGYADFWTEDFNGAATITAPINFGGSVFTAGSRVISETEFDVASFGLNYYHAFQITDEVVLRPAGLIGGRWINYRQQLQNTNALIPFTETQEFSIFLPSVGLRTELQINSWLTLDGMVQWFSAGNIENRDVDTFEFMGGATITIFQGAYLGAGWRYVDFDITDRSRSGERLDLDVEFSGVYLELGYRF